MTARALAVLASVSVIAAEDTRHSGRLLHHFGIGTPLVAVHEHNESAVIPGLFRRLDAGEDIALISDAGTPLLSDPGYRLIRAAHQAGYQVAPVPGPSALTAALSVSAVGCARFVFEGFLPVKTQARLRTLRALRDESRSMVFFEAPHRIAETLAQMVAVFGEAREGMFLRELTKTYETIRFDTLGGLSGWVGTDDMQRKGEIVMIVAGCPQGAQDPEERELERILAILLQGHSVKEAVGLAAQITGARKNLLYRLATGRPGG